MRPTRHNPVRRWGVVLTFALLSVCALPRAGWAQTTVWELTPYRIGLIVAVDPMAGLGSRLQQELPQGLINRIETGVGAAWDAHLVTLTPQLRHRVATDLAGITPDDLDKKTLENDKILFVAVVAGSGGPEVRVRELDGRTQTLGPIVVRSVAQTAKIRDAAFSALVEAFVPLAVVSQSKGDEATLRLRAGELPTRDPSIGQVRLGDVFVPIVRYNDREGQIRKIEPIRWTFLLVNKIDATALQCQVHSALYSPLSGRRRGRVEMLALLARPTGTSTRILLRSRADDSRPMVGYDIYGRGPFDDKKDKKKLIFLGRTDVDGGLVITPGKQPLWILDVKHGAGLLARMPVLPGLTPKEPASIRDDDLRMAAEALTTSVQEQLVDTVTRRRILLLRGEKYLQDGKLDKAEEILKEIRSLPSMNDELRDLTQRQLKMTTDDKFAKKQMDTMFEKTRELITKYLDPTPVDVLDTAYRRAKDSRPSGNPSPSNTSSSKAKQKPSKKKA